MTPYLVAAPAYLAKRGTPKHPLQLAEHACLGYAYLQTPNTWRFTHKNGEVASVRTAGPLRVNNGDAMLPALIAGLGLGVLPDFILREALKDGIARDRAAGLVARHVGLALGDAAGRTQARAHRSSRGVSGQRTRATRTAWTKDRVLSLSLARCVIFHAALHLLRSRRSSWRSARLNAALTADVMSVRRSSGQACD